MALGKTVSYTPFEETSFGYGSAELATNYATEFPNSDDIVKIEIEHSTGNWGNTGHLSTPSSGTAVAVYNEAKQMLVIKGERDDVDTVLDTLSFYPADAPSTRTWTPTAFKGNQTNGSYTNEEPPAIGNTVFTIKAYNSSDTQQASETVTFSVTDPVFGNQRPYWSSMPPLAQDLNSTEHDNSVGGLVDLGTISHGSDTENVQVKCKFRHYDANSTYYGDDYGRFTLDSQMFIGDKKPAEVDSSETGERFNFTGSVAEAQAFLDNVRYYNAGNQRTFDMYLSISDGVVGSDLVRTFYFSDAKVLVNNHITTVNDRLADVKYAEDADPAYWDLGTVNFDSDNMPEVDTFTATLTISDTNAVDSNDDFTTSVTIDTKTFNASTGVLTLTHSTKEGLAKALRFLQFTPVADYNSTFTIDVDFTFSSTTYSSSYTSDTIQISAEADEDADEVFNLTTSHDWVEDQRYDFTQDYPQIIHGRNDNFDVIFTVPTAAGKIRNYGTDAHSLVFTNDTWKITGTRDNVNTALTKLYFVPNPDYDETFDITFTVDRISGGGTPVTHNGTFTMNATALGDFSFPLTNPEINWTINQTKNVDSRLIITDTADENEDSPVFGSTYTVIARLRQNNTAFTNAVLTSRNTELESISGEYTNELTLTGKKDDVNTALANLIFIPNAGYPEWNTSFNPHGGNFDSSIQDFYIDFKVTRDFDGNVLDGLDFSESVRLDFKNPVTLLPFSATKPQYNWVEDTPKVFDTGLEIKEKITENEDYKAANGFTEYYNSEYRVTAYSQYWTGSEGINNDAFTWSVNDAEAESNITVSGKGIFSDKLILTGSKYWINKALKSLKMTPSEPDIRGGGASLSDRQTNPYPFYFHGKLERVQGDKLIMNFSHALGDFNPAPDTAEYLDTWTGMKYKEDDRPQYVFSHLGDIIKDGAGDIFDDVVYDVTIKLENETTGKFEPYVAEDYIEDTDLSVFVTDFEVRIIGSKQSVNEAIETLQFKPFADVHADVGIRYSQKKTYNNITTTHATNDDVGTIIGESVDEFEYGKSINNLQFFVQDEFLNGVDTTRSREDIVAGNADVILTPKRITQNANFVYDRFLTVLDTFEDPTGIESLYRIKFEGGTLVSPITKDQNGNLVSLGAELSIMDTGYQTKSELHQLISDGLYVVGVNYQNDNIPEHGDRYTINFNLQRKTANGTEAVIKSGTLTYYFTSGLRVQLVRPKELDLDTHKFSDFIRVDIDNFSQPDNPTWINSLDSFPEQTQNGRANKYGIVGSFGDAEQNDVVVHINRNGAEASLYRGSGFDIENYATVPTVANSPLEDKINIIQCNGNPRPERLTLDFDIYSVLFKRTYQSQTNEVDSFWNYYSHDTVDFIVEDVKDVVLRGKEDPVSAPYGGFRARLHKDYDKPIKTDENPSWVDFEFDAPFFRNNWTLDGNRADSGFIYQQESVVLTMWTNYGVILKLGSKDEPLTGTERKLFITEKMF